MEIQLTRTKTITIGGPKAARPKSASVNIVGVDLFSGDPRGCPAVRLVTRKGVLRVAAAGFVPPPEQGLPDSWESAAKKCAWSLPSEFQAPSAAFSVTSEAMFFAQTTAEAFRGDLAAGSHREECAAPAKRIGVIRKPREQKPAEAPAQQTAVPAAEPGKPVSNGGTRFVMLPMKGLDGFVLESGLPEYQLLWLSRLLPEGRRPTATSVQLRPSALAAALLKSGTLKQAGGTALAVVFAAGAIRVAGFCKGELVLWRECRGLAGWSALRTRVKDGLGLEDDMVESVLDDTLIDPRPVLEAALAPVLDELGVSRDYLVGKLEAEPKSVSVIGLPAGFGYCAELIRDRLHLEASEPSAFEGLEGADRLKDEAAAGGAASHVFLGALGAALATLQPGHLNLLAESECVSSNPVRLRVMMPVLALLAGIGMLVWWGILFGRLLMIQTQANSLKAEFDRKEAAHAHVLAQMDRANELDAECRQLDGYRLSRRTWGKTLSNLAEAMPVKVQLTRLEIPPPPPQILRPPGWRGPSPWGPTGTTDRVSLVLTGRTTKDTPVITLMESLESETFTNALEIVKDPRRADQSPRVKSFRQEATSRKDGPRMLAFEIEYRARERRFAQ